jgi:hypothetical protein
MATRHDVLEFAVLGVLSDGPLHGYELRKRLAAVLGPFRALSYGSLYPCLRRVQAKGLIEEVDVTAAAESVANQPGPEAWEDEGFAAHLAFFSRTEARVRLRILEGRRSRLEERVQTLRESLTRSRERVDAYTLQLQQHGLDGAEREVRWLNELIAHERDANDNDTAATGSTNIKEQ